MTLCVFLNSLFSGTSSDRSSTSAVFTERHAVILGTATT